VNVPTHIAIIMDGNGRWAKQRGLPRFMGHREGSEAVRRIIKACGDFGVRYLTLYTFSTENWQRPAREIAELMRLLGRLLVQKERELQEHNVRVRAIGRIKDLPEDNQQKLARLIERTRTNTGVTLTISLSYGGRSEIVDACRRVIRAGLKPAEVTEQTFPQYLYDPELPDVDLVVRTAGEKRLSNFLLWQAAYAEYYFSDALWPEFNKERLLEAITDYSRRERKFGRVAGTAPAK
jgi:undecaprenyl diphosphate synthase